MMLENSQNQFENTDSNSDELRRLLEYHGKQIHRLKYEYSDDPNIRLDDAAYGLERRELTPEFSANQLGKYRVAWFHAIIGEIDMMLDNGVIDDPKIRAGILRRQQTLQRKITNFQGLIRKKNQRFSTTELLVEEGNRLLDILEEVIQKKETHLAA